MAGLQGRPEDHQPDDPQIWIDFRNAVGGVLTRQGAHPWNLVQNVLQQDVISRRLVATPEGHVEEGDDVDPRSRRMQDDAWEARRALAESVAASHAMDFTGAPMGRLELTRHDREMEQPQDVPITKADDFGKLLVRRRLIREVSGGDTIINNTIINNIIDPYLHPWRQPPTGKHTSGLFGGQFDQVNNYDDNKYIAVPCLIPKLSSFTGITVYVKNVLDIADATLIAGLYRDDTPNCRPSTLIAQGAEWEIPSSATTIWDGDWLFSFTGGGVSLEPAWYWLVMIGTNITAGGIAIAGSSHLHLAVPSYITDSNVGGGVVGNRSIVGFINTAAGYPGDGVMMNPFANHIAVNQQNIDWPDGGLGIPPRLLLSR